MNEFIKIREKLVERWPGIYIPKIPEEKRNSSLINFINYHLAHPLVSKKFKNSIILIYQNSEIGMKIAKDNPQLNYGLFFKHFVSVPEVYLNYTNLVYATWKPFNNRPKEDFYLFLEYISKCKNLKNN